MALFLLSAMRSASARPPPISPPSSAITASFRATGITAYLKNGSREHVRRQYDRDMPFG